MSFQACAELVRQGDPERFMATMAAPVALRERLFAVYAFNLEVARAAFVTEEPMIAEIRLQWWLDALQEIQSGTPARRHEVVTPLAEVLNPAATAHLLDLVEARRLDARTEPLSGWDEAADYVRRSSGNLMVAAASLCGATDGFEQVREYGAATGTAAYLIGQPAMAARGRHRLEALADPETVAGIAREAVAKIDAARPKLPRLAVPAARAGWLSARRLRAIANAPDILSKGGPRISEFSARWDLLWRSLRGVA